MTVLVTEWWYVYPEGSGLLGYYAAEEGTGIRLKDVSSGTCVWGPPVLIETKGTVPGCSPGHLLLARVFNHHAHKIPP